MQRNPIYLTAEGLAKLESELNHLRTVRRAEIASQIHQAKELADTVDNAEYDEAKNAQAFVEGRIHELERILANAQIIEESHKAEHVRLGCRVTVLTAEGEATYHLVGSQEADPRRGHISNESPIGRAILGKRVGDEVTVAAPAGSFTVKIVAID